MCAAFPGRDFNIIAGAKLLFSDAETWRSLSRNEVVIQIRNDEIAEPRESFICTLQGRRADGIQTISHDQVVIEIRDNDGEHRCMHQDFLNAPIYISSCFSSIAAFLQS